MSPSGDPRSDTVRHFNAEKANGYDARIQKVIPGYALLHALTQSTIGAETGGQGNVLIVGAGTGTEAIHLAGAFPSLSVDGIDPSPDMLAVAQRRIAEAGLGSHVTLHHGTVDDLPAVPVFDAATLLLVMHFVDDDGGKARLLKAIGERLKPGAILLLADMFGRQDSPGFKDQMKAWRQFQEESGIEGDMIDKGFRHVAKDIHTIPEDRLSELLHEAGFGPPAPFFRALMFGGWMARKQET